MESKEDLFIKNYVHPYRDLRIWERVRALEERLFNAEHGIVVVRETRDALSKLLSVEDLKNKELISNYDALKEENKRLKQALNTILNLGRPNGDYATAFSKTKTIANNALNTLTVTEDGNNEAKAL